MCTGGQDIPATIRVDGGVEDGQWKTSDTFNPSSSEETSIVESSEEATETMEPSAGLYQPVIDRINTLSERLPEKISKETTNEISPMFNNIIRTTEQGFRGNQMGLRSLQNRLGQGGIRPRIDPPRPPSREKYTGLGGKVAIDTFNKGGFGGKGFGSGRSRAIERVRQEQRPLFRNSPISTISTPQNSPMQQVMQPPVTDVPSSITPTTSAQTTNPGDTFKFFNQPEFLKSTSSMQSYKNGGIIEALMMTPIGQNELKKLAVGGVVGGLDTLVSGGQQTGASLEDISLGKATFFEPFTYKTKAKDTLESIEETLGITPTKKKIIENQEQFGDHEGRDGPYSGQSNFAGPNEGGGLDYGEEEETDWGALGRGLANAGSAAATIFGSGGLASLFSVGNAIFNKDSIVNKVKDHLTRKPDPQPVQVQGPRSPFVGFSDEGIGYGTGGGDSIDVGGTDPGVDAMGQATGQEMGEEDDSSEPDAMAGVMI